MLNLQFWEVKKNIIRSRLIIYSDKKNIEFRILCVTLHI